MPSIEILEQKETAEGWEVKVKNKIINSESTPSLTTQHSNILKNVGMLIG